MKIKKTLAIIMATALTVATMSGCSQTTLNYAKELSNTGKWEATTSNMDGTIDVQVTGVNQQINISTTGYKTKNVSYVDMKLTDPSDKIKLPEIKTYFDGTTSYISKSYFEGIYALTGQAVPEGLANIKEEFIGVDLASSGMDVNRLTELSQPDGTTELIKLIFGENTDLDLPFVQNGREYSLNLDSDKTVELAAKALKAAGNNIDEINNNFKMGLPAESIIQMKAGVNDPEFDMGLAEFKTLLAGTTISSKESFTDAAYNSNFSMNLKMKDYGSISIATKSSAVKSEVKEITLPANTLKVTQEQLNEMLVPANTNITANTTNTVTK
jgi:hypothetical protein